MSGDGLFWAARLDAQGQVEFYRGSTPTPGAAEHHATPVRYLYMDETGVRKLSWPHCAAIDAAIAAQAQAEADARAAQEAARQTEAVAAQAAHDAVVQGYRDDYAGATAQLCQLAGLEPCRVLTMAQIQAAVMPLLTGPNAGLVNGLLTLLTNLEQKLTRPSMDGDDALDRV